MRTISRAGVMRRRNKKYFTTGVYFAAAAAASTRMLVSGERLEQIEITTPTGSVASFNLADVKVESAFAECAIVKETEEENNPARGMKLSAHVSWLANTSGGHPAGGIANTTTTATSIATTFGGMVSLVPGDGIGIVTKPGLCVPVGDKAIHPNVRDIIIDSSKHFVPLGKSVEVIVSITDSGKFIDTSKESRIGIRSGISVFDTECTEIKALKSGYLKYLQAQIDIAAATGEKALAVLFDDYGVMASKRTLGFTDDAIIVARSHVADAVKYCVKKEIKKVVIIGGAGDILQIIGGSLNGGKEIPEEPIETLKRVLRECSKDAAPLFMVTMAPTVEDAATGLMNIGQTKLLDEVANRATKAAGKKFGSSIEIGTVVVMRSGHVLAACRNAVNKKRFTN
jgi:cobalt-precorrin-5B (C1)-methyltransferase